MHTALTLLALSLFIVGVSVGCTSQSPNRAVGTGQTTISVSAAGVTAPAESVTAPANVSTTSSTVRASETAAVVAAKRLIAAARPANPTDYHTSVDRDMDGTEVTRSDSRSTMFSADGGNITCDIEPPTIISPGPGQDVESALAVCNAALFGFPGAPDTAHCRFVWHPGAVAINTSPKFESSLGWCGDSTGTIYIPIQATARHREQSCRRTGFLV